MTTETRRRPRRHDHSLATIIDAPVPRPARVAGPIRAPAPGLPARPAGERRGWWPGVGSVITESAGSLAGLALDGVAFAVGTTVAVIRPVETAARVMSRAGHDDGETRPRS